MLTFLLCALLVPPAPAATPLGLREAVDRALVANPDLVRTDLAVDQARAAVLGARAVFEPSLSGNGSWSDAESRGFFQGFAFSQTSRSWGADLGLSGALPTGTAWSVGASSGWSRAETTSDLFPAGSGDMTQEYYQGSVSVGLQQDLMAGLVPAWNLRGVRTARQAEATATVTLAGMRELTVSRAVAGWQTWSLALRREAIAAEALDQARTTERAVRVRAGEGHLTALEVGQAELARVQAEADLLQARTDVKRTADDLLVLLGEAPGADLEPAGEDLPTPDPGPVEPWIDRALAANPDVTQARADLDAARLAARDARLALLPSLSAQASASLGSQADTLGGSLSGLGDDDAFPAVGAGLVLAVPLGNKAARAEALSTAASLDAARVHLEDLERSTRARVLAQHRAVGTAREALELATVSREVAARNAAVEEVRFKEGTRTLDRLLDARVQAERAALSAETARVNLSSALLELHRLAGGAEAFVGSGT